MNEGRGCRKGGNTAKMHIRNSPESDSFVERKTHEYLNVCRYKGEIDEEE